jgi:hypothetical protein
MQMLYKTRFAVVDWIRACIGFRIHLDRRGGEEKMEQLLTNA